MNLSSALLISFVATVTASYCGQAAVPFTFQVLRAGYPVLGCARPRCFGWTANGTRVPDSAQFYRINGKEDGYLRRSDVLLRQPYRTAGFVPQVSTCDTTFRQNGCDAGQWVGGLAPQSDPYTNNLQTRCCAYGTLFNSEDRGIATLRPGQMVVGGEVTKDGRLIAFDYIANLNKIIAENGTIIYNVHVRRMACFDDDANNAETITSQNSIIRDSQRGLERNPLDVTPNEIALQSVQDSGPARQLAAPTQQIAQPPGYNQQQQQQPQQQQQQQLPVQQNFMGMLPGFGAAPQVQQQPQQQGVAQQQFPMQQQQGTQQQQQIQQLQPLPQAQQQGQQQGQQIQQLMPAQNVQQQQQQQQQQQLQNLFPMMNLFPQQPQQPMLNGMPAMPTLPPINLPKLEDIPKIDIPSIEDVEQSIPPVQRAILTSVARFFGVL